MTNATRPCCRNRGRGHCWQIILVAVSLLLATMWCPAADRRFVRCPQSVSTVFAGPSVPRLFFQTGTGQSMRLTRLTPLLREASQGGEGEGDASEPGGFFSGGVVAPLILAVVGALGLFLILVPWLTWYIDVVGGREMYNPALTREGIFPEFHL
eukprot:TRINITY_DN14723_c0_g1_i1.p1 TRINITY_DN14723_c0_g1~~TRINITY_DN14723_c0_g1_i1.p1  ORF type:complete len:168 (-),score=11.45 TRINITY_DN14723_c0_g1_i1:279-740(-)